MDILVCEKVRKVYGSGNNQVTALDGIDLTVRKGEFVAIVGASGSGKSTLLHILGSVEKPTSGKVTIDGTDLSRLNQTQAAIFRRRKVGLVYQFYNLIDRHSVTEHTGNQFSVVPIFRIKLAIQAFDCHFITAFILELEVVMLITILIIALDDRTFRNVFR